MMLKFEILYKEVYSTILGVTLLIIESENHS